MDLYIKAVEEIGFKKTNQDVYESLSMITFKQNGVELTLQVFDDYTNIFTSKSIKYTEKAFNVFRLVELQLPQAIRSIVRFWAKNGVKLGKAKEKK